MHVSDCHHFKSQKKHNKEHKLNIPGFWWYIEFLWSETIGLCKKLNIIYNIITCNPELQANSLERCPVHERINLLNRIFFGELQPKGPVSQTGLSLSQD